MLIAGTYNAHPIPCAAAIATIEKLARDGGAGYEALDVHGGRMEVGLRHVFESASVTATVVRQGSAFCAYFADHAPADWHDLAAHHDFDLDLRYRTALIEAGVFHFPLPTKQGSISLATSSQGAPAVPQRLLFSSLAH